MTEVITLKAAARDRVGKGAARAARRAGLIPAVIYGGKQPAKPITLSFHEMDLRIHKGHFLTSIFEIDVDGETTRVIPRDYQLDPVRDMPVHIDFLRVSADTEVTVEVPVHFENEEASPGIKRGGVLNVVRYHVEVHCPADAIPEAFTVDLTGTDIGDSIHISAVALPAGVTPTISDRDFTIATIAAPAGLKESLKEEAEAGED